VPAAAQTQTNDGADARIRLGPLGLTPSLAIRDLGMDTNVFNEAVNPKSDFTTTLAPETLFWLRAGRLRISGGTALGFTYFRTYDNQRAINVSSQARMAVPFNRFTPYVSGSLLNSRARPGLDIDLRARRLVDTAGGGVEVRLSPKTTLDITASRSRTAFESGAVVEGTSLRDGLSRKGRSYGASLRYALTPLTTIVLLADRGEDRFVYSPRRSADMYRIMPGVEFKAFALITGHAQVGYRSFKPVDTALPPFHASLDLTYLAPTSTRFTIKGDRDVAHSFIPEQPFYVLNGVEGSITQYIGDAWDVTAGMGRQSLQYRQRDLALAPNHRTGLTTRFGIGVLLRPGVRWAFDARRGQRRTTGVANANFDGWHAGTSIGYGF
jgi:hypothetical protein